MNEKKKKKPKPTKSPQDEPQPKLRKKASGSHTHNPSDEEDAQCIFCGEMWSKTKQDGMIQRPVCQGWAHTKCAGVGDDDFVCDFCA